MKYLIILLFGLSSIQLSSCEKEENQSKSYKFNKKEAEESITCESISIMCTQTPPGEYVIENNSDYQALLYERSTHPDCPGYELPEIDFSQYILVGYISMVAGCKSPNIFHEVNLLNDTYKVEITIEQIGICKMANSVIVWCLIPRQNNGSKVDFLIEEIIAPN